jgi:transcriptional regulator with XRE-family HTH domain
MIRRARELERLSMRGLARRSDLSAAQISRIETGDVKPSMETLAKLAFALQRPLEPLLIMTLHREPAQQGLADVRRLLRGLQRCGDGELAGRLLELDDQEEGIAKLQTDCRFLEGRASAELQHLDHLRAELALATRESERAATLAQKAGEEGRSAQAEEASARARSIFNAIGQVETSASDAKSEVDRHQRRLGTERAKLESLVFDTAERLFLLVSGERLARVRELTDPPSLSETEKAEWADAALSATLALSRTRTAGAGDPETLELLGKWDALTDARRKRVLDFIEDQRRLSAQEMPTDHMEGGGLGVPDQDEPE